MSRTRDYRGISFSAERIDRCGRYIGSNLYWKFYAVENTFRIVLNSVLTVQLGVDWWDLAVDPDVARRSRRFRSTYEARPRHANPGQHDIHLLFLSDLTDIMRTNSHIFIPVISDADQWIATLEGIRVPRNLVGHMNFPNAYDLATIDHAYSRLPSLLTALAASNIPILIPQ
jgi:hypothetical protein